MKETIFDFYHNNSIDSEKQSHKIDFIYEPHGAEFLKIKDFGIFRITKIVDEFTDNPVVQIRHVLLQHIPESENLIF